MNDDQALYLVRNPRGHSEDVMLQARTHVCDRFEQLKCELNEALAERDQAQHIAMLALDVEGWLFRTVDALTDDPDVLPEGVSSDLMGVYNDMSNARENRKKGG